MGITQPPIDLEEREIKFRAWNNYMFSWANLLNHETFDVLVNNEFKIMQYTGLKDKNGIEIYEGDILRWVDWEQEGTTDPDVYVVKYEAPKFHCDIFRDGKLLIDDDEMDDTSDLEVIGNIYENSSLLKQP